MSSIDDDRKYQAYRDLVSAKKLGRTPSEHERTASAIAQYLMLYDAKSWASGPARSGQGDKVDGGKHTTTADIIVARLDAGAAFEAAKGSISTHSHKAIIDVFVHGLDLQTVGRPITGLSEKSKNANGAVAKAHLIDAGDILARHFLRQKAKKR